MTIYGKLKLASVGPTHALTPLNIYTFSNQLVSNIVTNGLRIDILRVDPSLSLTTTGHLGYESNDPLDTFEV